ncbi:apolipoprotein D-like [Symsagittifera roscoffensis]|uniref:apolipoprotein D-like n=1 Tax=Symsagittifera roscoffensis TaxID=84072 RepID=UPI00307B1B7F
MFSSVQSLFVSLLGLNLTLTLTLAAPFIGECPDISGLIVDLPNLADYMGRWYEIYRVPNFEAGQECVFATYTLENGPNGTYVQVNNTGYGRKDGYSGIVGSAIQPNPPLAALIVSFSGYPSQNATAPNYNIIRLDTSSYAVIYSCDSVDKVGAVDAWILARTKTLPDDVIADLKGLLASLGVKVDNLHATVQSNDYCPAA